MASDSAPSLGIAFHRTEPAASVIERARQAEALGFDEFWVIEDCFYTSGPSLAAAALAATESITVGIGIMPVVARTAAIAAMEVATLAELAPGRFHAGFGHGVQSWMAQMGARAASPLTALDETIDAVQRLLSGETVSVDGRYVTLDDVALDPPPSIKPPVSAGVRGPKSMAIAGRVADGVILADFVNANYVRAVRDQLGRADARVTVFASAAVAPADVLADAKADLAGYLAEVALDPPVSLTTADCWPALAERAEAIGWFDAAMAIPDNEWTEIAAFGPPSTAGRYAAGLAAAGADSVVLFPNPDDPLTATETIATVRPL